MGFVLIGMAMARSGIHDTRVLARFGLAAFVLASAPCLLLAGSVAPVFAASDSAESSIWEPEGEALVDWCLDVAQEELYPCTMSEYEEQANDFSRSDGGVRPLARCSPRGRSRTRWAHCPIGSRPRPNLRPLQRGLREGPLKLRVRRLLSRQWKRMKW